MKEGEGVSPLTAEQIAKELKRHVGAMEPGMSSRDVCLDCFAYRPCGTKQALEGNRRYLALCERVRDQGCEDQLHNSGCARWKMTGMADWEYFPEKPCSCGLRALLDAPTQKSK